MELTRDIITKWIQHFLHLRSNEIQKIQHIQYYDEEKIRYSLVSCPKRSQQLTAKIWKGILLQT